VDVTGGSTNNHTLTGLQRGHVYFISIESLSLHLPSESVTTLPLILGQPESVTFLPVDATLIRVSWSGSSYLCTALLYTSTCTNTSTVIGQYETVIPKGVNSTLVSLKDDLTLSYQYEHNFTLYFTRGESSSGLATSQIFSDMKHFQIQLGPIDYCLDWGADKTARIERQLQSKLIQVIRDNCVECSDLTPSFLRRGLFLCHGNPTKTTYRSTIVDFHNIISCQLVGIIQRWVSTSPSPVLEGLLVRVSADCPTSVASLDEEECECGARSDPGLGERITEVLNVCALRELGQEVCSLGGC
jgi:hypothetical protein